MSIDEKYTEEIELSEILSRLDRLMEKIDATTNTMVEAGLYSEAQKMKNLLVDVDDFKKRKWWP